ncbi:hypothetical protein [Devosia sediminis]|uniref:Uncharacterized protein n=1 Tax=Devosia sediminis TaxID=2798801 RepID=A0A934IUD4_9HYPH|nr:hypothetical protein [Devosia sediminis]MBJ3784507.1 hypothetical protein [Devosia sediminis]
MQTALDFGDRPRRQFVPRTPEEIRTEAQDMLDTWGAFTADKKKVRGLVAIERPLTVNEGRQLSALIRKTKIKLIKMDALKVEGGVDWPAHHVEHVVRTMTRLDGDRAENLNNLGWGPEVSSKGHWCAAMLSIDRDRAIAVGRLIVEHYRNQTERLADFYPLPADWMVSS